MTTSQFTLLQSKLTLEGQLAYTSVSAILEWNRKMKLNRAEVLHVFNYRARRY